MGALIKSVALGVLCFVVIYPRSAAGGTGIPGGKLYYCDSDKQCHSKAKCLFNLCTCQGNYYGDGKYNCKGYRACGKYVNTRQYGCKSPHSKCLETGYSKFTCKCKDGYIGNPSIGCEEAKPVGKRFLCNKDADCTGYRICVAGLCRCPEGSFGNSNDDCLYSYGDCADNGRCTKPGTHCMVTGIFEVDYVGQEICMCQARLVGDPYKTGCRAPEQEDLCKWYSSACPENSKCKQIGKVIDCVCAPGHSRNDYNECNDINECDDPKKCAHKSIAMCTNSVGSFTCRCKDGFFGDGVLCERMPDNLANVAKDRPTEMQTTQGKNYPGKAVDGKRNGRLSKGSCARTKKLNEPWWRVDLGNSVWVEKVLLANRDDCCHTELSNVEIRIGNRKESNQPSNPICRQGLQVPKEPWLYSCAEAMLGKYVYIRLLGKGPRQLTICEVEVYVDKTANVSYSKFLVPFVNGKLEKPTFLRYEQNKVVMKLGASSTIKILKRNIIVDLPPREESLKNGLTVYIPVTYESYLKNATAACGREANSEFVNGKFVSEIYAKMKYAVNVTNNGDICKLQVKCQDHSSCESEHVSNSFPLGSYQCVCDEGYSSSSKRPGNVVAPGEDCIANPPPEPKLKYSKQNLALNSKTSSSPVDNYAGCKHKSCKEIPALGKLAVDGRFDKCYLSVSTNTPWLMIHLDGTHPIVSIQIATSKKFGHKRVKIYIGYSGKILSPDNVCAVTDIPKGSLWNIGCADSATMFGDVVKIQTASSVLALCEVEVYAEPYANVAVKHAALGSTNSNDTGNTHATAATDGKYLYGGPPCFYSKYKNRASWVTDLGPNNRVAMVFIYLQKELADAQWRGMKDIDIFVGNNAPGFTKNNESIEDSLCCSVTRPIMLGKYLECKQTLVGRFLKIQASKPDVGLELCEVEVFHTRIVNLAGRRPAYSSSSRNIMFVRRGTDHKMDEAFTSGEKDRTWWSVNLLVKIKIHMVRIVTALDYKKSDFEGLELQVGDDLAADNPNQRIFKWKPTDETVQVMTFSKNPRGRFVTLMLERKLKSILSFREVEVYNGQLIDVDECEVPSICPKNLKCVNLPISFTCECRDGYKPRAGNSTDCLDIDECADAKSVCPLENSYCLNTVGSHKCLCIPGYASVYDGSKLSSCRDIDECSNSSLYSCPTNYSICINEPGSYRCGCTTPGHMKGWSSEYRDQDINCIDADECNDGSNWCHLNATCANTIGSYTCTCNYGTKGDGKVCESMDSCSYSKPCIGKFKFCKSIKQIRFCVCEEGYEDVRKKCIDKNECATQENNCGPNSVCSNMAGSYGCTCRLGYKSTSHDGRNCKDTDECKEDDEEQKEAVENNKNVAERLCGETAQCQNVASSYFCRCPTGFAFDENTKACMDFDECADSINSICGADEWCVNTVGSYACSCKSGFRTNEKSICEDIDECSENHACDQAANCNNTLGGYNCICKAGYRKKEDGRCEEKCSMDCDEYSYCYHGQCMCLPGYEYDPSDDFCYDPEAFFGSSTSLPISAMVFPACLVGYLTFAY